MYFKKLLAQFTVNTPPALYISLTQSDVAPMLQHKTKLLGKQCGVGFNVKKLIPLFDALWWWPHPQAPPRFYLAAMEKNQEKAWEQNYVTTGNGELGYYAM